MPCSPRDMLTLWSGTFQQKVDWLTDWRTDWLTDSQIYKSAWEKGHWIPDVVHAKQAVHIKDLIPKFHPSKVGFTLSFTSCYIPAGVWRKIQHSVWVEKPWEAGTKDDCRSKHFWLHRKLAKDPFRDIFPYCRTSLLSNLLSKHFRSSWCLNSIVLQV